MLKLISIIFLALVCTGPVHAQSHCKADPACSERGQALLDSAIDSLTKSYRLQPDDQVTKYYLQAAFARRWLCLYQALLDLGPEGASTDAGRGIQAKLNELDDQMKEFDLDFHPYIDAPIGNPDGETDNPTAHHSG